MSVGPLGKSFLLYINHQGATIAQTFDLNAHRYISLNFVSPNYVEP